MGACFVVYHVLRKAFVVGRMVCRQVAQDALLALLCLAQGDGALIGGVDRF